MRLKGKHQVLYPMLASLYLTHRCNLRCCYCSDGSGAPFWEDRGPELSKEKVYEILQRIVKSIKVLNITGGEPLLREDILEIVAYAKKIGFKKILLNTNGLLLDKNIHLLNMVDTVYISLDSLSVERLKDIYRVDENTIATILDNIEYISESVHSAKVVLSSVILPGNIDDIYKVLIYCQEKKIGFAASPSLHGTVADESLRSSHAYRGCIDTILDYKKKGLKVIGTTAYYMLIRDLKPYQCHPMLMPTIDPMGRLYLPCLELKEKMVDLLKYSSLNEAIKNTFLDFHYPPKCGNVCHILCHAGLSVLFESVTIPLGELFYDIFYSMNMKPRT
ncbi:MAG: radical SAM protein [bacterium]